METGQGLVLVTRETWVVEISRQAAAVSLVRVVAGLHLRIESFVGRKWNSVHGYFLNPSLNIQKRPAEIKSLEL